METMIKAAKGKRRGSRWMRWEGGYLGFGHARAVRESDFHAIASEARYFSVPLGKVWLSPRGSWDICESGIIKKHNCFPVAW